MVVFGIIIDHDTLENERRLQSTYIILISTNPTYMYSVDVCYVKDFYLIQSTPQVEQCGVFTARQLICFESQLQKDGNAI